MLRQGERQRAGDLVVARLPGQPHHTRYGLVVGKRIGNAVQRNRTKRRLRAAIRTADVPAGFDYVYIAGPEVSSVGFPQLLAWVREASQ